MNVEESKGCFGLSMLTTLVRGTTVNFMLGATHKNVLLALSHKQEQLLLLLMLVLAFFRTYHHKRHLPLCTQLFVKALSQCVKGCHLNFLLVCEVHFPTTLPTLIVLTLYTTTKPTATLVKGLGLSLKEFEHLLCWDPPCSMLAASEMWCSCVS
jgi:hypothetical protein